MSSLKSQCGNCYKNGITKCEPVEPPLPNFTRIDSEVKRLESLEEEAEKAEATAEAAWRASRAKLERLRKQKRLLKRREQKLIDDASRFIEDIEHLEALEALDRDVVSLDHGLMPGVCALDWAVYPPPHDPDEPESPDRSIDSSGTLSVAPCS